MKKMKVITPIMVIVLLAVLVFTSCASALDFGYSEIVDYEPNKSITFELVIKNPLDKDVNITDALMDIPWGTDFVYSNNPFSCGFFPGAKEADERYGGVDGTKMVHFNINKTLHPHSSMEIFFELKINDWVGHSPNGLTQWAPPYYFYAKDNVTYKDIFIRMDHVYGHTDEEVVGSALCPRSGTFADYGGHCVFDLSPDIVNNEYGISSSVSELEPGKPEDIAVTVWNGNGTEVKNAMVKLTGCGVFISDSAYPYEFEGVNATSIGKIRVSACWVENNITMNAVDFIPVSPSPNHKATFDIHKVMPVAEKPVNISAKVTDGEGVDMVLVKYWKDGPWRMYESMKKDGVDMYSTEILPFWSGDVVNYQILCIDATGNITESEINQFTVTPY